MANRRGRPGRRARSAAIYTPVAALLILFIAVFGVSVFFRIARIEVTGASKYSAEEIIRASRLETGDNLIFADHDAAARRIRAELPYVNEVKLTRRLPDVLAIEIRESAPIAVVTAEGRLWIIDSGGKILEESNNAGAAGLIRVAGITPTEPKPGEKLAVPEESGTRRAYLLDILGAIETNGMSADVDSLDVSNISGITFRYLRRFDVNFGSGDDALFKLQKLPGVAAKLREDREEREGTIEFTKQNETHFVPKQ
ncbi:MAG: FtsQ-type POTRA domain-containing protein [Oscillospiraceae bacterium]|jgi:cell division protein FtsQ|nr:FtsQ-type POTRA domain-containing protein [Oscillospiraceae bacterium]